MVGPYQWVRSWKLIKREELARLKEIVTDHQICEAEKERLRKLDNPLAKEIQAQIERSRKIARRQSIGEI